MRLHSRSRFLGLFSLLHLALPAAPVWADNTAFLDWRDLPGAKLLANTKYDRLMISGLQNVDGWVTLSNVSTDSAGKLVRAGGGVINYVGPLKDFVGGVFEVNSVSLEQDGVKLTGGFKLPPLLSGAEVELSFLIKYSTGSVELQKMHIGLTGTIPTDAFAIQNAYIDIDPVQGSFGGGGLLRLGQLGKTIGGWMDFKSGVGPMIGGRQWDVVRIGAGSGKLHIPIGACGAFLDYLDASITNDKGLSDPKNWLSSDFTGNYRIVFGEGYNLPVVGTVYAYTITGTGKFDVQTGGMELTGSGKLLNYFETANVRLVYSPPGEITAAGQFNSVIFSGDMTASMKNGAFKGKLNGKLSIPDSIPVIGGKSLAAATAEIDGATVSGRASLKIGFPRVCVPGRCGYWPPCIPGCGWCKWRPCGCSSCRNHGPYFCTPEVCTPALTKDIYFNFSYSLTSGKFSFSVDPFKEIQWDGTATQQVAPAFELATDWQLLAGTKLSSDSSITPDPEEYLFILNQSTPGILFRATYTGESVPPVSMTVDTPDGQTLTSWEGDLPAGYASVVGYSRLNPSAREQTILLAQPKLGAYHVVVNDGGLLGTVEVQSIIQNPPPLCSIVNLDRVSDTQYLASCHGPESPAAGIVAANLVTPDGNQSVTVAEYDAASKIRSVLIDTLALALPDGQYYVTLTMQDGLQTPQSCTSNEMIVVASIGVPAPVSDLRFLAEDGGARVLWAPSPTWRVSGYLVEYCVDHGLPEFDQEIFVDDNGSPVQHAHITGLENGVPILVRVFAIGADTLRSPASDTLRILPMPPNRTRLPRIVSVPGSYATAGLNYVYRPALSGSYEADVNTWALSQSPTGMSIDSTSGLVQWTPGADQLGEHAVVLDVAMQSDEGTASTSQSFSVQVNAEDDLHGLPDHAYVWLTHPPGDTYVENLYEYQPTIYGPDENIRYDLQVGPPGMTVDPNTGLLSWQVSADAKSQWVRLRAVVDDEHEMTQDFFVFVQNPDHAWPDACAPSLCGLGFSPFVGLLSLMCLARAKRHLRRSPAPAGRRREMPTPPADAEI